MRIIYTVKFSLSLFCLCNGKESWDHLIYISFPAIRLQFLSFLKLFINTSHSTFFSGIFFYQKTQYSDIRDSYKTELSSVADTELGHL